MAVLDFALSEPLYGTYGRVKVNDLTPNRIKQPFPPRTVFLLNKHPLTYQNTYHASLTSKTKRRLAVARDLALRPVQRRLRQLRELLLVCE